ncbi:unnamed protein product [Phyllotreta striolata]|uniref:Serine protease HTRA2, mitochondrial n=1 Tax=Phyllotreta striolata TaxID=444603 RepID=A0A9N9TKW4_PHYSR|nr:unnamed protein product [Phyllotreta striolata]
MTSIITKISRPLATGRGTFPSHHHHQHQRQVPRLNRPQSGTIRRLSAQRRPATPPPPPDDPKPPEEPATEAPAPKKSLKYGVYGAVALLMAVGYWLRRRRDGEMASMGVEMQCNNNGSAGDLVRSQRVGGVGGAESGAGGTPRERYNFINKVVKQCAPAVFYLEIRDPNKKDVDGKPLITSNGSGFVVDEEGWALTNAHVVLNKPGSIINAILRDGRSCPVRVEDVDINIDLALLKLDAGAGAECGAGAKVPCLAFGDGEVAVGEWVVALGSPLSLSNSVTVGIVSCVNRPALDLGLKNYSMSYIQTDAAITFGNSGGPLVNLDGNVIGINNLRLTSGISFAIPAEYAKRFLENTKGKVKGTRYSGPMGRALFGITTISITPEVVEELRKNDARLPPDVASGLLVWKIVPGTAAAKGGLKVGDIITHVNGVPAKFPIDLYSTPKDKENVELTLIHGGKEITLLISPDMFQCDDW